MFLDETTGFSVAKEDANKEVEETQAEENPGANGAAELNEAE